MQHSRRRSVWNRLFARIMKTQVFHCDCRWGAAPGSDWETSCLVHNFPFAVSPCSAPLFFSFLSQRLQSSLSDCLATERERGKMIHRASCRFYATVGKRRSKVALRRGKRKEKLRFFSYFKFSPNFDISRLKFQGDIRNVESSIESGNFEQSWTFGSKGQISKWKFA